MRREDLPLEGALGRPGLTVGACLLATAALGWGYLGLSAYSMAEHLGLRALGPGMRLLEQASGLEAWGARCLAGASALAALVAMPDASAWSLRDLLAVLAMWLGMLLAMMLPSAGPTVLAFADIVANAVRGRALRRRVGAFVAGYLLAWWGFALAAGALQWGLHASALMTSGMVVASPWIGGALLLGAGAYQWSGLKHRCLSVCRSPLAFFLAHWREGALGALAMGVRHGAFCIGCCWALMLLMFLGGMMNLLWIALLAALMLVEKTAPGGAWLARLAGMGLIGMGLAVLWPAALGGG